MLSFSSMFFLHSKVYCISGLELKLQRKKQSNYNALFTNNT